MFDGDFVKKAMRHPRNEKRGLCRANIRWCGTRSRNFKLVGMAALLLLALILHLLLDSMFGFGTLRGGRIGQYLDGRILRHNIKTSTLQRSDELKELGIQLPLLDVRNNRFSKETPSPFGQLAARMNRTVQIENDIAKAETVAGKWKERCMHSSSPAIPPLILQPIVGNGFRQLEQSNLTLISLDEDDMFLFMKKRFPELFEKFVLIKDASKRVKLFSLCSLYLFGGYTFNSFVGNIDALVEDSAKYEIRQHPCIDQAVIYSIQSDGPIIVMFAASPRLPSLLCLIQRLFAANFEQDTSDVDGMVLKYLSGDNQSPMDSDLQRDHANRTTFLNRCKAQSDSSTCDVQGSFHTEYEDAASSDCQEHLRFRMLDAMPEKSYPMVNSGLPSQRINVDMKQDKAVIADNSKVPIGELLHREHAWPSWLCNRCLQSPLHGSFQACSFACNTVYMESQCSYGEGEKSKNVATIHIQGYGSPGHRETRIPRIIHQTWHSDVTVDEYPELNRLQNAWRASGFEYRFYNDSEARSYIEKNFPLFFVDCYDSILPGAYKADLFRLLVLLKDGGIYADIDVQLETSLSSFLTSDMSLFIPRETIRDLAGADYCLWNGLMGSTPGHPVIAKAVERLLESISTRADYFDIERYACKTDGPDTPLWKIRALTTLIVSGPCKLKMFFNGLSRGHIVNSLTIDTLTDCRRPWNGNE